MDYYINEDVIAIKITFINSILYVLNKVIENIQIVIVLIIIEQRIHNKKTFNNFYHVYIVLGF